MINRLELCSMALLVAAGLVLAPVPAGAGSDWELDWWTIDGGGEVFTLGGTWELSNSLGQWDATTAHAQVGGQWQLTGGFWALAADESDLMFRDGFE